jgi:hypothetical protein
VTDDNTLGCGCLVAQVDSADSPAGQSPGLGRAPHHQLRSEESLCVEPRHTHYCAPGDGSGQHSDCQETPRGLTPEGTLTRHRAIDERLHEGQHDIAGDQNTP